MYPPSTKQTAQRKRERSVFRNSFLFPTINTNQSDASQRYAAAAAEREKENCIHSSDEKKTFAENKKYCAPREAGNVCAINMKEEDGGEEKRSLFLSVSFRGKKSIKEDCNEEAIIDVCLLLARLRAAACVRVRGCTESTPVRRMHSKSGSRPNSTVVASRDVRFVSRRRAHTECPEHAELADLCSRLSHDNAHQRTATPARRCCACVGDCRRGKFTSWQRRASRTAFICILRRKFLFPFFRLEK